MHPPSLEYARTLFHPPKPVLKGPDALVDGYIGRWRRRSGVLEGLRRDAEKVDALATEMGALDHHALAQRLLGYRDAFRRGGKGAEASLIPSLAGIREAAERQLGLRPFVVQIMGALALHRGYLAEMATGEGKTLTAGMAGVLAGWTRRPCHIITVNDYLVKRDAAWLESLYHFCGVRVGCVTGDMPPEKRRHGYECDVTYTTSKEVVADFLRDNLQAGENRNPTRWLIRRLASNARLKREGLVMRGLHTAIVDEADSVLIDEAVTPLIISAPRKNESLRQVVTMAESLATELVPGTDYTVNDRYREIELTEAGLARLESLCEALPGMWRGPGRRNELIKQALVAHEFYQRDKQYVLDEGKLVIVDEFTGRRMAQRSWRQGMHQAVEAKEGLELSDPTETIARLSFQRFFRLYFRISGMTGTAREAATEFWAIYKLPMVSIPPNRPCVRRQFPERIYSTAEAKWQGIVDEVRRVHATGQPILVGTRSVAASEALAERLEAVGVRARVLNAMRHQDEAVVVATAGGAGCITIATNMAGRGTDIKLDRDVAALGGLHVIATERHESGRVDRQLFGRCARQGGPGSAQAFASSEDELVQRFLPKPVRETTAKALQSKLPLGYTLAAGALNLAQHNAQRQAFKQRASILRMDDWMEESLSFAPKEF
jgi:preprotein translocase subunit SecA